MDALHPTAEWESVDGKWFRKTQLYTEVFEQDRDLDNFIVVGAPFAGALGKGISARVGQPSDACLSLGSA